MWGNDVTCELHAVDAYKQCERHDYRVPSGGILLYYFVVTAYYAHDEVDQQPDSLAEIEVADVVWNHYEKQQ